MNPHHTGLNSDLASVWHVEHNTSPLRVPCQQQWWQLILSSPPSSDDDSSSNLSPSLLPLSLQQIPASSATMMAVTMALTMAMTMAVRRATRCVLSPFFLFPFLIPFYLQVMMARMIPSRHYTIFIDSSRRFSVPNCMIQIPSRKNEYVSWFVTELQVQVCEVQLSTSVLAYIKYGCRATILLILVRFYL